MWAALAAAAAGLLLVEAVALSSWIAETRTAAPLSVVLRTGAAFWLLGNGGHLHLPAGNAALIPLGLSVLFFAFAMRSGASVARVRQSGPRRRSVLLCALAVAIPYALLAALVAASAGGGGLHAPATSAFAGAFVLSFAAGAAGAARELPMPVPQPSPARAIASGVGVAAGVIVAVCALLAAGMILLHMSDVDALARPARAGAVGGFGLFVLQAGLAPNATIWTFAYLLGPGFSVGAATSVSPSGVHLGDLPALPMLGGLPNGPAPWPCYLLFLVPPAAGVLGGVVAVRRWPGTPRLPVALALGGAIAAALGVIAFLAAALSGGPVTRGRLATIGPSPLQTAAFTMLEAGLPALLAALALTWYRRRGMAPQPAGAAEPGAAEPGAAQAGKGLRERLRERLPDQVPERVRGIKPRAPGFGLVRRGAGSVTSAFHGLGMALGLDRVRRPAKPAGEAAPPAEPVAAPVVDLVKAERPVVSLVKNTHAAATVAVPVLPPPSQAPAKPARFHAPALRARIPLPKRLRRKPKVIKLPD